MYFYTKLGDRNNITKKLIIDSENETQHHTNNTLIDVVINMQKKTRTEWIIMVVVHIIQKG